jgi:hypothetical protein
VPPRHPPEFGRRAIELARERSKSFAELAKDLRISESCGPVLCPGECSPKVVFPLVRELADDNIDLAVTCRVLNVSRSGYDDWLGRLASR